MSLHFVPHNDVTNLTAIFLLEDCSISASFEEKANPEKCQVILNKMIPKLLKRWGSNPKYPLQKKKKIFIPWHIIPYGFYPRNPAILSNSLGTSPPAMLPQLISAHKAAEGIPQDRCGSSRRTTGSTHEGVKLAPWLEVGGKNDWKFRLGVGFVYLDGFNG